MAQTRKRRSRKHRGTQAGTVERSSAPARRGSGGGVKGEARRQAQQRRVERLDRPPTWRGALNRAALMAAIFGVLVVVAFDKPVAEGAAIAAFMLLLYIPMSYFTDRFIYRRRHRARNAGSEKPSARG